MKGWQQRCLWRWTVLLLQGQDTGPGAPATQVGILGGRGGMANCPV